MTTDIPAVPSIDFDHHSEHYARHWREINAQNRAACPVAHTDAHGGFWVLSSYEDIATVAKDDAAFSSYQELDDGTHTGATIPAGPIRQVPIEMDPGVHGIPQAVEPVLRPRGDRRMGRLHPQCDHLLYRSVYR
ncbi:hypothetical protein QBL07_013190 [Gordonia rubripertincta]|uniref:hypothetical protein n=1 Tax=Gordonia rubripertincta TaxID=36822 RepID=UPI0039B54D51